MFNKIRKKFFQKNKKQLKDKLIINQKENEISITGHFNNNEYEVKQLWMAKRGTDEVKKYLVEQINNEVKFKLDLTKETDLFSEEDAIYDFYIYVYRNKKTMRMDKLEKFEEKHTTIVDGEKSFFAYPIRLGRFKHTQVPELIPYIIEKNHAELYVTTKGGVSLTINKPVEQKEVRQIDYLKTKKNKMEFGGKLFTRSRKIKEIKLQIIGRENSQSITTNVDLTHLENETSMKFGLNRYYFKLNLNIDQLFKNARLTEDIYDYFFLIKYENFTETRLRIGKPRFRAKFNLKSSSSNRGEEVATLSPYYTVKYFNLSVQLNTFETSTYKYLKKLMRWSWLLRLIYLNKKIWIVGERPYKAQDTGYRFFKYLRETRPEINAHYVIEENSPELDNIKKLGNIIYYKSKKHIKYTLFATRIIGSHHPDYLYPLRTHEFIRKVKGKKVFIQHGVFGTKNIEHFYGKKSLTFDTDYFIVSSDFEKEIAVNDLGYDADEVAVTGLSRFDSLFEKDITLKRQILIIPTWREWLVREEVFLNSEYFERYKELVYSEKLKDITENNNLNVILCLHPNMQIYSHHFENAPVTVVNQGEIDVQDLIKESVLMITDYSSVAFDFSFLKKPVIYYQFDQKRYIGPKGSHLDLSNDLPGPIIKDYISLIDNISYYVENDFQMKEINQIKTDKFLKYYDQNSSQRIANSILNDIPRQTLVSKLKSSELYNALFNRFRKNKRYFKSMELLYKFIKTFTPIKEGLIVFESGVGKQYADSPRAIYEKLVEEGYNYKFVWVNNKPNRYKDINTKRIKRLSPSYYYYLARAEYWVNNQNFPHYIEKRKGTTYLQTWHGTPLKRMQHDIEKVVGRDDGYLDRVSKMKDMWDYLISPSPYASKAFRSAFKYEKEIIETGYPRNDLFYNKDKEKLKNEVLNRLNLPEDKKIILYAPTFRDNQTSTNNKFLFDIEMDLHEMKEKLGENYIVLLRMHVVVVSKLKIDESLEEFVFNVSNYPDIQELQLLSDILITDYSSVMFDYANTGNPILFFTYDLENYRDNIRGFYMDFENEAPGPLVFNTEEIIESVLNVADTTEKYKKKYQAFQEKYCSLEDGKASERVVEHVFKLS